ncbi:iron reductase [Actinomadura craniellae]|uniref:Iron reductase n=1 Tax=Actinomadura craniellae TaxID=2231787 RepID=A0A365H1C9_9ACTN|nr:(2Fe-2S)-binding protein [Actinomadura craniellae]RAY12887.1 iron reductase [Actinomadura craniellae]
MTALRPAPSRLVATALADVAELGPFFSITVGGPDPGWHPMAASYAAGLQDLVAATARRYRTGELRIAASVVQLGHAARLWSPVLACALVHGVVPDLDGLQRADEGPHLRVPAAHGRHVPASEPPAGELYRAVVTEHLEALAAGLHVKVAPRLLYGNAASALVEAARAILAARPDLRDPLVRLTGRLLDTGRLAGTGDVIDDDLAFRRRSCCLYYRVPDGVKCEDCALV